MLQMSFSKNLKALSKYKGFWNEFERLRLDEVIPRTLWAFFDRKLTVRQAINTDAEKLARAVQHGSIKLSAQATIKFLEKEEEKELDTGIQSNLHLRIVTRKVLYATDNNKKGY